MEAMTVTDHLTQEAALAEERARYAQEHMAKMEEEQWLMEERLERQREAMELQLEQAEVLEGHTREQQQVMVRSKKVGGGGGAEGYLGVSGGLPGDSGRILVEKEKVDYTALVTDIYLRYRPEKLEDPQFVGNTLRKYAGGEQELVVHLRKKYAGAAAPKAPAGQKKANGGMLKAHGGMLKGGMLKGMFGWGYSGDSNLTPVLVLLPLTRNNAVES
jgi:hypothetical protein